MRSFKTVLILCVALILTGCSEQADLPSPENEADLRIVERPFKVKGSGTFDLMESDGSCGALPWQIALEGSGKATHVGLFTVDLTWCFQPPEGPLYIFGTLTAANGDEIYMETTGQGIGENGEVYETFSFIGGTGRFEEVSGAFDLYTTTVFGDNCFCGTYSNYGEGSISY
jgi:hypothetical protein